jgi:hypothetical protein
VWCVDERKYQDKKQFEDEFQDMYVHMYILTINRRMKKLMNISICRASCRSTPVPPLAAINLHGQFAQEDGLFFQYKYTLNHYYKESCVQFEICTEHGLNQKAEVVCKHNQSNLYDNRFFKKHI